MNTNAKLKVAMVNVGQYGHGHNVASPPQAIITIAEAVTAALGERVTLKIFDQVISGEGGVFLKMLEDFSPDVILVSVQVTGYYPNALQIFEWARQRSVAILAGGFHFTIPEDESVDVPGSIARIAAVTRGVSICYADGESTAVGYLRYIFSPEKYPLSEVPNLVYLQDGKFVVTSRVQDPLVTLRPFLPCEVFDYTPYWRGFQKRDGKVVIGGQLVAPRMTTGCVYRDAMMSKGREACEFCTLVRGGETVGPGVYWDYMRHLLSQWDRLPLEPGAGVVVVHPGDDMANNLPMIRGIYECMPTWWSPDKIPIRHRMYARIVPTRAYAEMLRDIGVRWLFIGGDGKEGFDNQWRDNHPLVRSLRHCREVGLFVHVSYVLGRRGQTWEDIYQWRDFAQRIVSEFGDVLMDSEGWVNVIAPGSPDWKFLAKMFPHLNQTDAPDLEEARALFWEHCTQLCAGGISPDEVRNHLYTLGEDFRKNRGVEHNFMLNFRK